MSYVEGAQATTCPECLGAMTELHPRWDEFCERLAGPEACDFKDGKWKCSGKEDKPFAAAILIDMGFSATQLAASLEYFDSVGGFCDCEILYNT